MSFRSMFLDFRFFGFVLVLVAIFCLLPLRAQEIMPLNQIRPGDKGYGLTVFAGSEPERFDFEVVGVVDSGWGPYIMVNISGGPKDKSGVEILRKTKVMGGMSGSPMFTNDGKIIGALSSAPTSQIDSKALITPIESMINFRPNTINEHKKLTVEAFRVFPHQMDPGQLSKFRIKPGDMYTFCFYWGDDQNCPSGTVTYADAKNQGMFLALGHQAAHVIGPTALPFWKSEVLGDLARMDSSYKIVSKVGPVLGSVIFDGPFGQIIKLDALPRFFPMTVTIENYFPNKLENHYFFAYTRNSGAYLATIVGNRRSWIGGLLDVEAEIAIDVVGHGRIYFKGDFNQAGQIGQMIDSFITENLSPAINSVNVILRARTKYQKLGIQGISANIKNDNNAKLAAEISIAMDGDSRLVTNSKLSLDKKYLNKKLYIAAGAELANLVSSKLTAGVRIADVFNTISDRNALYLFSADEKTENQNQDSPKAITLPKNVFESWLAAGHTPANSTESVNKSDPSTAYYALEIIYKINMPAPDYVVNGKKNFTVSLSVPSGQPQKAEKKKNKKFFLFRH